MLTLVRVVGGAEPRDAAGVRAHPGLGRNLRPGARSFLFNLSSLHSFLVLGLCRSAHTAVWQAPAAAGRALVDVAAQPAAADGAAMEDAALLRRVMPELSEAEAVAALAEHGGDLRTALAKQLLGAEGGRSRL